MRRLQRSNTNNQIAGVCGGLGEYLNIDPTLIRVIFLAMALFGGPGVLLYFILWIVMPEAEDDEDYMPKRKRKNDDFYEEIV